MSEKINDGGPELSPATWVVTSDNGMALRDWFAGLAMQGMLSTMVASENPVDQTVAAWSYDLADALLVQREKGKA